MNPLKALHEYGQSVWLDYIRRSLITSGELRRLVDEDGLCGVTSNPAIFEKIITGSNDYASALAALARQDLDASSVYEQLAIHDIQDAAEVLWPVYEKTKRRDGYVSLEVSPYLARDTQGTVREARRLWQATGRDNAMIKVPATTAGVPAIRQLISEGINVNVTLLFSRQAYEQVAEAYLAGLEELADQGGDVSRVAGVASFFISRIDATVDALITSRLKAATSAAERLLLRAVTGKAATANAKLVYQRHKDYFRGGRWQRLEGRGAQAQRLLWASTGVKNPQYRDVVYVEELIGPDTVNTMPPATLAAFREHGVPRASLEEDIQAARDTLDALEELGISMTEVTDRLLGDGVRQFAESFDRLLAAVDKRCNGKTTAIVNRQSYTLPEHRAAEVEASLEDWRVGGKVRRLWERDASLWTGADEGRWLGWLDIVERQMARRDQLSRLAEAFKSEGWSHALVLGMGGSSLCPEVLSKTFGKIAPHPELLVLDSTDPAQIVSFENRVNIARTLFIVSSKSGTTLEPNLLKAYFSERVRQAVGDDTAGGHFMAITDPGSALQRSAEAEGFREVCLGLPDIGGRFSALSDFGVVPAAIMGVDVLKFLGRAEEMVRACAACVPVEENPGVVLGTILGVLGKDGRDKVTIITSPAIADFGAWLEQLLAESTGKDGKGLIPIDREPLGAPEAYAHDRLFVYLRLESRPDGAQDAAVDRLERGGQPVVRIAVPDVYDLGQEFLRWQMATAVAGAILGINPFNQPDVEASKVVTRELMDEYERTGALPPDRPMNGDSGIRPFADERNAALLEQAAGRNRTTLVYIKEHLNRLAPGDCFAILAFVEMNDAHEQQLQAMRRAVRDTMRVATCHGFGPRYLHSTGQLYKGGPNTGIFLQITCEDDTELPVPGRPFTFGVVKAAQARGDLQVMADRGRRILRVHLGARVLNGLQWLREAIEQALTK